MWKCTDNCLFTRKRLCLSNIESWRFGIVFWWSRIGSCCISWKEGIKIWDKYGEAVIKNFTFQNMIENLDDLTTDSSVSKRVSTMIFRFYCKSSFHLKTVAWLVINKFVVKFKIGIARLAKCSAWSMGLKIRKWNSPEKSLSIRISNSFKVISTTWLQKPFICALL